MIFGTHIVYQYNSVDAHEMISMVYMDYSSPFNRDTHTRDKHKMIEMTTET